MTAKLQKNNYGAIKNSPPYHWVGGMSDLRAVEDKNERQGEEGREKGKEVANETTSRAAYALYIYRYQYVVNRNTTNEARSNVTMVIKVLSLPDSNGINLASGISNESSDAIQNHP
ncbi:hypothetical protein RUM44_003111 [Polyplax serrata]|uniref:Uncharacterized protein n=1 Tax=Polyplax serrata TaxID=468196 RepID=A0ABR1AZ26_POLSC